jgi:hypothetical protein
MRLVDSYDLVVMFRIDEDDGSGLIGFRHAIDDANFHAQNVPTTGIPRNRLALTDISKEMMLLARRDLHNLQFEWRCFFPTDRGTRHHKEAADNHASPNNTTGQRLLVSYFHQTLGSILCMTLALWTSGAHTKARSLEEPLH